MNEPNNEQEAERLRELLGLEWTTTSRPAGDGSGDTLHGVEFRRAAGTADGSVDVVCVLFSVEAVVVTFTREIATSLKVEGNPIQIKEYLLSFVDPKPTDRCAAAQKLLYLVQTRLAEALEVVDASLGEFRPRPFFPEYR